MASDWAIQKLGHAGVTLIDCDHRTPPAAETGFPYVAIPQMKEGRIELSGVRRISREHFIEWTKKAKPQEYDVVLSRRCNPGVTAHVPAGLEMALGQNLVLLRADGRKVHPPFLRWLTSGQEWWDQVGKFINVGAVFESLRCRDIPGFELTLPPLAQQKRIAHILGSLDDKIELNRRMNGTLEAMARALFQSWFVDFDPVRRNAEGGDPRPEDALFPNSFENSIVGEIPKGWKSAKVSEICKNIFSGGTPRTSEISYWNGTFPWLSSGETRNSFIIETEKTITQLGIDKSSTRQARKGCVVIASAGQGHTRGQTSLLAFDSYINQSVVALAADNDVASDLFLYLHLSRRYEEFRQLSDSHSSRGSLTTKLLGGVRVVLPAKDAIQKFDSIVGPMVARIIANLQQSRALSTLRDTLLPKLLSWEATFRNNYP